MAGSGGTHRQDGDRPSAIRSADDTNGRRAASALAGRHLRQGDPMEKPRGSAPHPGMNPTSPSRSKPRPRIEQVSESAEQPRDRYRSGGAAALRAGHRPLLRRQHREQAVPNPSTIRVKRSRREWSRLILLLTKKLLQKPAKVEPSGA